MISLHLRPSLMMLATLAICTVAFDPPFNSTWLRSYPDSTNLTTTDNVLRWDKPKHFSTIFTYLQRPVALKEGSPAVFKMNWRSSGSDPCPESCVAKGAYCQASACDKCKHTDPRCLAGTGDFRIALLDTSNATSDVAGQNWCPKGVGYKDMTDCLVKDPFPAMKGYDFRIFPHLTRHAKHEPGQVPCSIYRKTSSNLFGKHPRLGEWGCFGAPENKWTDLELSVERRSRDTVKVSMTMNGVRYSAEDKLKSSDSSAPHQIDAVAIGYPNGRGYGYIELSAA